jgi:hypothetical protein
LPTLKYGKDTNIIGIYELMETVIDVADPGENKLVNDVTIKILKQNQASMLAHIKRLLLERWPEN